MSGSAPFKLNCSGVMLALLSTAFASQAGAAAGRAEFVIGTVTVAGRDAVERPLTRGTELDNGDVVRTNDGRAQIRFTDGAYVSLQPNTEFGIREYLFENKTDGSEKGFFGLLKGAMRTVTGAIGRVNRNRYQITTPTATVGIRGTGGVIQVLNDGSTLVIGTSGVWSLTNPAGSIDVPAGVSGLSPSDPDEPPRDTTQQPTSGPAPLPTEQPQFTQGEERTAAGDPVIAPAVLVSGSGFAATLAHTTFRSAISEAGIADAIFNSSGQLTRITANGSFIDIGSGSHAEFGTDGVLAWGRWIGQLTATVCEGPCSPPLTADQGFHYVIGMPTPMLPAGTANYSLLGATAPTYVDGSSGPGTFSGALSVDFGKLTVAMKLDVSMPDSHGYSIGGSALITSGTAFFSGSSSQSSLTVTGTTSTSCISGGCNAQVNGFFSGATAERAGLSYYLSDSSVGKEILGAAAFQKQ